LITRERIARLHARFDELRRGDPRRIACRAALDAAKRYYQEAERQFALAERALDDEERP
jgi:hypothetical protein